MTSLWNCLASKSISEASSQAPQAATMRRIASKALKKAKLLWAFAYVGDSVIIVNAIRLYFPGHTWVRGFNDRAERG